MEWNVRDSDGTLVIAVNKERDPGMEWTVRCAQRYKRPLLLCDVADPEAKKKIEQWLGSNLVSTLNVAGPSELTSPGIGDGSYALLKRVLKDL